jgi:polar amino acid transport system substrate-binding protein
MKTIASAVCILTLAMTAACGSDSESKSSAADSASRPYLKGVTANETLASKVPDEFADGIVEATDPSYPPSNFIDENGDQVGYGNDLTDAIVAVLDIPIKRERVDFASIIPGIEAGRYTTSRFNITEERLQKFDMVSVTTLGTSLLTKANNPGGLDLDDLCGQSVGVEAAGEQATVTLPTWDKACKSAGKPGIDFQTFPGSDETILAVKSGRVDGAVMETFIVGYAAKQDSSVEVVESSDARGEWGFAFEKGSGMAQLFGQAINELIESGVYADVLDEWGVADIAITEVHVNGEPLA